MVRHTATEPSRSAWPCIWQKPAEKIGARLITIGSFMAIFIMNRPKKLGQFAVKVFKPLPPKIVGLQRAVTAVGGLYSPSLFAPNMVKLAAQELISHHR